MSGNIIASSSGGGSGIGTGYSSFSGTSTVTNLMIMSGNITASSSGGCSGIGTGNSSIGGVSTVGLLKISGTVILFCTGSFPINASSIILSNTSLTITTPQNRVFAENPLREDLLNLSIAYETVTSKGLESVESLNSTFLQIGNVSLPDSNFWTFCLSGIIQENCFNIRSTEVKSFLFSVPLEGNYSIRAFNDDLMGFIGTDAGLYPFDVSSDFLFVPNAYFIPDSSKTPTPSRTPSASLPFANSLPCADSFQFSSSLSLDGSQLPNHDRAELRASLTPRNSRTASDSLPFTPTSSLSDSSRFLLTESFRKPATAIIFVGSRTGSSSSAGSSGLSSGAVIGIIVGSVVVFVLLLILGILLFLHQKSKQEAKGSSEAGEVFGNLTEISA
jgi:hypothetical protein